LEALSSSAISLSSAIVCGKRLTGADFSRPRQHRPKISVAWTSFDCIVSSHDPAAELEPLIPTSLQPYFAAHLVTKLPQQIAPRGDSVPLGFAPIEFGGTQAASGSKSSRLA